MKQFNTIVPNHNTNLHLANLGIDEDEGGKEFDCLYFTPIVAWLVGNGDDDEYSKYFYATPITCGDATNEGELYPICDLANRKWYYVEMQGDNLDELLKILKNK